MGCESGKVGDLTIALGAAVSNGIRLADVHWLGVQMPAAWDAANLYPEFSFLEAPTAVDADWWEWRNITGAVALPAAANAYLSTSGEVMPILTPRIWLRLCSGARSARVNQTAARVLQVYSRRWA